MAKTTKTVATIVMPKVTTMRGGIHASASPELIVGLPTYEGNQINLVTVDGNRKVRNRKCRIDIFVDRDEARQLWRDLLKHADANTPLIFRAIGENRQGVSNLELGWFCHVTDDVNVVVEQMDTPF
jgi:hypothetical protein